MLNFSEKWFEHRRHPATHYHNVGIEQINDVADPRSQDLHCLLKNLSCQRIAGSISLSDHLASHCSHIALGEFENPGARVSGPQLGARPTSDRRSSCQRFDAS